MSATVIKGPGGRPTSYNNSIIEKTQEYLDLCQDVEDEFHSTRGEKSDGYQRLLRVKLPTIEGLSVHLKVNRTTIYEWKSSHPEFSNILDELMARQASLLLNKGLSGDYNHTITKLMLTKHGYTDKTETDITSAGKEISISISEVIAKKNGIKPQ